MCGERVWGYNRKNQVGADGGERRVEQRVEQRVEHRVEQRVEQRVENLKVTSTKK